MSFINVKDDLVKGKIVVLPTDTIYGIHAIALNKNAVEKVYKIRGRSPDKPFIILISSLDQLKFFGVYVDRKTKQFLLKNWPAKLSVILPVKDDNFYYLHRSTQALAFRIPDKKDLVDLIEMTGPLISTSANPEGQRPAETIKEAKEYFGEKMDRYVDGGRLKSKPSTLAKIEEGKVKVLREGVVKIKDY